MNIIQCADRKRYKMYDEITVQNITTLALWSKDLVEENALLKAKVTKQINEIYSLNEKIKQQSALIEEIRADINERVKAGYIVARED